MTTLQQQARALGDPTRHRIFRYLAEAERPVDVVELTTEFGLNHNAIRQHLAKLVAAGLVVDAKAASTGRGRPRLLYSVHPATGSRGGVDGPYERLSILLAEVIRTGDSPVEVGRRAGRRARRGADTALDPVAELADQMAQQGFDPTVTWSGDQAEVTLHTCPFATTALADPEAVCGLHLGLAYGVADTVTGLVIDGLVTKDPRRAQCRLRGHVEATADPDGD
jgi:predicted ArsR family transcriptional regulator